MIGSLNKKIHLLLIGMYALLMVSVCFVIGYAGQNSWQNETSHILENHIRIYMKIQNNQAAAESAEEQERETDLAEQNFSEIYLIEKTDETYTLVQSIQTGSMPESEWTKIAEAMLATGKQSGIEGDYQFEITDNNGSLLIAFSDIAEQRKNVYLLVLRILAFGLLIGAVWVYLSRSLAALMVEPLNRAQQKQEAFVMAAGHELKTPVAVMETSLEMLEKEGVNSKYLQYAREENRKMKELVTELLDLSRLQNTKAQDQTRLDISSVIEGCVLPFEAMAYEKSVELTSDIEKGLFIRGSEKELERMTDTLIENALYHTKPGGRVRIILKKTRNKVCLSVENEGNPIPAEERDKLFERFYRSEHTETPGGERHYGLGLSIAQEIAGRHQSRIHADSREGWNCFMVEFAEAEERL